MPVPAKDRIPLFCVSIASACAAAGALIARAAADTLFLDYYGTGFLLAMYVGTGLLVGVPAFFFARHSRQLSFYRILLWSCSAFVLSALLLRVALLLSWSGARILIYFWSDISVGGSMLLFWSFFGQVFNLRQARSLLGWVGAAATLACVLAGFLIRPFTQAFGTANLLLVVAVLFVMFAASAAYWARSRSFQFEGLREMARSEEALPGLTYYFHLLLRPRVQTLALRALVGTVIVVMVDYFFKVFAQAQYQGPDLASFFGRYYGVANILVLAIQVLTLNRLLRGKRLLVSLSILPTGLLLGSIGMMLSASFWIVVGAKLIVQTTLFTVDSAASQILFLGFKHQTRN